MGITILTETDLRSCVSLGPATCAAIAAAFSSLQAGEAELPPIMRIDIPEHHGELDVKAAYLRGYDQFAVKLSAGFFNNFQLGLPSTSGMMILLDSRTGLPCAVLLDNGYLTDVRTAAAGAVAAQHLARREIGTAGVIGAGAQARYQMLALHQVRPFQRLLVYGPTAARVTGFVEDMKRQLGVEITVAESPEQVVRDSDVVVTATPSREPLVRAEWLHPGLHITAMGADAEHKHELDPQILRQADALVCDRREECFRLGELHHGLVAGTISETHPITELGELTAGQKPGRTSDEQITVCDLTGSGVQDTAIAVLAYELARAEGLGFEIGE